MSQFDFQGLLTWVTPKPRKPHLNGGGGQLFSMFLVTPPENRKNPVEIKGRMAKNLMKKIWGVGIEKYKVFNFLYICIMFYLFLSKSLRFPGINLSRCDVFREKSRFFPRLNYIFSQDSGFSLRHPSKILYPHVFLNTIYQYTKSTLKF